MNKLKKKKNIKWFPGFLFEKWKILCHSQSQGIQRENVVNVATINNYSALIACQRKC